MNVFTKQSQIRRIDATNYKVLTTTIPAAIYEENENKIVSIFSGIKDKTKQKQANYYNNNRIVLFWNDSINKSFCYKNYRLRGFHSIHRGVQRKFATNKCRF